MGVKVKTLEVREVGQAMWRGASLKCPHCGKGHMFRAYLKVADECDNCGEVLSHHRADDLPPYVVIMIVGHLLIGLMLHLEMVWHVNPQVYLYTLVPLAVILPLAMLPSVKGAIVGLQWANRMFGFDPAHRG
ncbi:DUF983 domain-containing protein [Devosia sp.]|uniref:DUF983 domain-containing protein n=1 Tax=Devosia sp. TaxID=1871048 RepID=UPI0032677835